MSWFKRTKAGILTATDDQNETPDGQWVKCGECDEILNRRELIDSQWVCGKCGHHFRINSKDFFALLFDDDAYTPYDEDLKPVDALNFSDRKTYRDRLESTQRKSKMNDAVRSAMGKIGGHTVSVAAMDFTFIGGSMGSVVGEVIARAIKRAYTEGVPLLIISQSGGARMMEGALSLMQMGKTSAHLTRLAERGLPYISLLTNPTTGGVTASFAMLGDINIAEPKALIGFAGPRVIRETMGQDLPDGFQRAEFLKDHGFVDQVVDRRELKAWLTHFLDLVLEPR